MDVSSSNASGVDILIESMQPSDWSAVQAIYAQGIATRNATFETNVPEWETWDRAHLAAPRLVARRDSQVLGFVALTPISARKVYAGVADLSIYIAESGRGQGIGKRLLLAMISESEQAGIWTIQTSIFPENVASIGLHTSCGFRVVGQREKIAQLDGIWRDTVLLERRVQNGSG